MRFVFQPLEGIENNLCWGENMSPFECGSCRFWYQILHVVLVVIDGRFGLVSPLGHLLAWSGTECPRLRVWGCAAI